MQNTGKVSRKRFVWSIFCEAEPWLRGCYDCGNLPAGAGGSKKCTRFLTGTLIVGCIVRAMLSWFRISYCTLLKLESRRGGMVPALIRSASSVSLNEPTKPWFACSADHKYLELALSPFAPARTFFRSSITVDMRSSIHSWSRKSWKFRPFLLDLAIIRSMTCWSTGMSHSFMAAASSSRPRTPFLWMSDRLPAMIQASSLGHDLRPSATLRSIYKPRSTYWGKHAWAHIGVCVCVCVCVCVGNVAQVSSCAIL